MANAKSKNTKYWASHGPKLFSLNSTEAPLSRREDCPFWEWVSQGWALVILALFPLMIGPRTYYNITVTKYITYVVLTCLYMVACVVIGLIYRPGKRVGRNMRERWDQKLTLPQILLMAYVLWALISTIASPYTKLWVGQSRYEGMFSILLYAAAFLLLSFWGEYTDAYAYGLGIMGAVIGCIALIQTFGSTFLYPDDYNYRNVRFLTTIGNVDCVAGIVNVLIPLLLAAFVILRSKRRYICLPGLFFMTYLMRVMDVDTAKVGFAAVAVLLPCFIQSRDRLGKLLVGFSPILAGYALGAAWQWDTPLAFGRTSWVCFAAAVVFAALGWLMGRGDRVWKVSPALVRRVGYVFIVILIMIAMVLIYGYEGENKLLNEASAFMHGELADSAGSNRGYLWKSTAKLIKENPILGGGPGSFYSLFIPYNDMDRFGVRFDFPHNDFLNIGACTGLVGLVLYLAFLIALALRCIKAARRSQVIVILMAGMMGYLVYSFFVFSIAIVSPLFWVMAGLADKCVRQTEQHNALTA